MTDSTPMLVHQATVLPEWVDANGHMNVAWYAAAFDQALDRFFDRMGIGRDYTLGCHCALFVVESHFTYQRELLAGDRLAIRLQLLDRDRKRIHCFMELYNEDGGFLAATSEQIAVHVDLETRKSLSMPAPVIERLTDLLALHKQIARPKEIGHKIGIRPRKPRFASA